MLEPEIYDSSTFYERCTFLIKYSRLVDLLETCPHTDEFYMLLKVIKAVKKSKILEEDISKRIPEYEKLDGETLWTEDTGWKDNQVGFLAFDSQGNCEVLSTYISYSLLRDLIANCKDEDYKQKLLEELRRTPKQPRFIDVVKELL